MNRTAKILIHLIILMMAVLGRPRAAFPAERRVDFKGIETLVAKMMAEWKVPGIAVSVVKDGRVVYSQCLGTRDVSGGLKVTPHTLFAIGSCSKAFGAAGVGILVEEGKLDWDTPVRTYIPTFKLFDQMATERLTPRDLLCHRSGLPRHDLVWYGSPSSRRELVGRLQFLEPSRDFRTTWQYQNLMYMTAGYLVEVVSGASWEEFTRKRIFEPLGMKETNFSVTDLQLAPDFALPYAEKETGVEPIPFRPVDVLGPAGSVNSNILDMSNWIRLNLARGKFGDKQVIAAATLAEIHAPQMVVQQPLQYEEILYPSYGLGWMITPYRGHLMLMHAGGVDGFSALVFLLPQSNAGAVVLTNMNGSPLPSTLAFHLCDRLLGLDELDWFARTRDLLRKAEAGAAKATQEEDKARKPNTRLSHALDDYVGDYSHPGYGTLKVAKAGDNLVVRLNSLEFPLRHYHYDTFEFTNELFLQKLRQKLIFFTDARGNIGSLAVPFEPAVKEIVFVRAPDKNLLARDVLEKFVGQYEMAGVVLTCALKGEATLTLTVPGQTAFELVPARGTEFGIKGYQGLSIEFVLDESGAVTGAVFRTPNGIFDVKRKPAVRES